MKKSLGLLMIVIAVIAMAFVSCDASTAPKADAVGEVVLDSSQSRGISVTVDNTVDVETLYWYYKAEKKDNGLFNTGVTNGFVPVKKPVAGVAQKGLQNANLGLFSYGNWEFTLRGVVAPITGNTIADADIMYSGSQTIDVNKDKNFLNLTLIEGNGLTTEIKFDTNEGIWFSHSNIVTGKTFSLTAVDYVNGVEKGTITSGSATVEAGKVSFKSMSYAAPEEGVAEGQHVMRFTLTQNDVASNIATVATYELTYTVTKGYTHTIKGDLTSAEVKGEVEVDTYAKSVPATTATLVLPVTVNETNSSKTVKDKTTVSTLDLSVTYHADTVLTTETNTAGSGDNVTADATIGFKLNPEVTGGISTVDSNQDLTKYELILNVAQSNTTLVEVSKFIGKNLEIEGVYHSSTSVLHKDSEDLEDGEEYYDYSPTDGVLKLYVKHASPIDIVTKKALAVASIGDRKYTTLDAALADAVDGDTVTLLDNVDLSKSIYTTISKSIIIDGGNNFILSSKPVTITAANFEFRNVGFAHPTNTSNNASCVYVYSPNKTIVFDGCSFEDNQWDAIQCTSKDMESITIKNCVFALSDDCTNCYRFIHIEPRNNGYMETDAKLIIKDNIFYADNDTCNDSLITVYGPKFVNMSIAGNIVQGAITLTDSYSNGNIWISDGLSSTMWRANNGFEVHKVVTDVDSLKEAVDEGTSYIILGGDVDLTGSGGSEQIFCLKDLTLDLNGHTINGSIWSGSYLSTADGTRLTLIDSKSGGQIYSKFRFGDGGAMMQANAVTAWQHAVTINSGKYFSNNVAVVCQVQNTNEAEGVIINGGYFGGTYDLIEGVDDLPGPVGGCVSAVIGTVTINGGTFKAAQYGSVITAKSGSSKVNTVVNINGGTFEGACMFDFGKDHSKKTIVNVYGGNFEVKNPDDPTEIIATSFAYDNYTHAALVNNDMSELNIMGGTFNYDPSAYVNTANYNVTNNGSTWTVTAK